MARHGITAESAGIKEKKGNVPISITSYRLANIRLTFRQAFRSYAGKKLRAGTGSDLIS
jgi:hypothetical protein